MSESGHLCALHNILFSDKCPVCSGALPAAPKAPLFFALTLDRADALAVRRALNDARDLFLGRSTHRCTALDIPHLDKIIARLDEKDATLAQESFSR